MTTNGDFLNFPEKFLCPQKTIFRKGAALDIAAECLLFGQRGLLVHGRSLENNGNKENILNQFPDSSKIDTFCRQGGEPTLGEISSVIEKAKAIKAEWIAGIGGGSVIDLAKAAAGLYGAKEKPVFYQQGGKLEQTGVPFIAVPTTAGTGSEATINSVIINSATKEKLSIRDKSFLARTVILDVELLKGLPKQAMVYAAMDAYVQAYESFISKNATEDSEQNALKAIELIDENILLAYETGREEYLSDLLLGSYLCGIAFGLSRLGVIHGIAHSLGVLYDLPHGLICAVCLPASLKINRDVMGKKYDIMSKLINMDFQKRITELMSALAITSPFKDKELIEKEKIIAATLKSGSTKANPKDINKDDVEFILNDIFQDKII
ncbi:MAG: iron-containing alcohol dehydrogenase [PVC group bacterium]|nr:iron-containing alcohol dehydrogenase [PVC group bacterium]